MRNEVASVHVDGAPVGVEVSREDLDEGRFPRSVLSDEAVDKPAFELGGELAQGERRAEAHREAFDRERGRMLRHRRTHPVLPSCLIQYADRCTSHVRPPFGTLGGPSAAAAR